MTEYSSALVHRGAFKAEAREAFPDFDFLQEDESLARESKQGCPSCCSRAAGWGWSAQRRWQKEGKEPAQATMLHVGLRPLYSDGPLADKLQQRHRRHVTIKRRTFRQITDAAFDGHRFTCHVMSAYFDSAF